MAFNINSLTPKYFSEAIKDYGGNLLHVSTDYVFNGNKKTPYLPSDKKSPINNYGYTKAKGEDFILENLSNLNKGHIIRTSWLMSEYRDNFALKILKKLSQNKDLRVINDQIGCPTTAFTLAKACWRAVNLKSEKIKIPQILHYCNSGIASWYDVAVSILEISKEQKLLKKQIKIIPTSSKSYPLQALRPHYSVLDTSDTLDKLCLEPIYWKESISDLLNQLKNS